MYNRGYFTTVWRKPQANAKITLDMPRPLDFLRSVKLELNQVKWPSHQEALKMTILVIVTSAAVAIYAGGLDYLFTAALQSVLSL